MGLTRRAGVMGSYDRAWQIGVLVGLTPASSRSLRVARPADAIG